MIFLVPEQINNTKNGQQKIAANKISGGDYLRPIFRPVFTLRTFKESTTQSLQGTVELEFWDAIVGLEYSGIGHVPLELRKPHIL